MILKGILNKNCSRLDLYGFILTNTYYLMNRASNKHFWCPKLWPQTKLFKLIEKMRDKILRWRKKKLPCRRRFLQGLRTMKKAHHIHLCQCTILILMGKIHTFHRTNLSLLFCMILHFRCICKKFIVHLSLKRFHMRGIMWIKERIIL